MTLRFLWHPAILAVVLLVLGTVCVLAILRSRRDKDGQQMSWWRRLGMVVTVVLIGATPAVVDTSQEVTSPSPTAATAMVRALPRPEATWSPTTLTAMMAWAAGAGVLMASIVTAPGRRRTRPPPPRGRRPARAPVVLPDGARRGGGRPAGGTVGGTPGG